jgi:hypothetical protein
LDTCTVEAGLLRKKPCGHAAVTHCVNCEQPLCAKHALPELADSGRKTGKFLCADCEAPRRQFANSPPAAAKKPAEPAKAAPAPANAAAPAKDAPAAEAPAPAAPKPADDGGIDFTPAKK